MLVTGLGAVLAVPGGLIPAIIVLRVTYSQREDQITISPPWIVLAALLIGLPLLAAAGAALLTRARMSPLI